MGIQGERIMPAKKKDFYTTREAAELLGVAVSTIQLWTNNGLLRAWTTGGGHRRIASESVEEILNQQQQRFATQKPEPQFSVVIVEDNKQQIRLYEKQFARWQLEGNVVTANNGYEGLIKIGCNMPDVIITDLLMPNMDGFQMLKAIREMSELEHCLIIIVSGLTEEEIKERGGLPEGVHFFTKPVEFEKLEDLIRRSARNKAA
jgi:excisionase family DNA binding protein